MLNVTLVELRRALRAETGSSLNPAQGTQVQATLDMTLARQQQELWDAYNWQHLVFYVDQPLAADQESYNYPREMPFEQITRIYVSDNEGANWMPLTYGISAPMHRGLQQGTPRRWANWPTVVATGATPITDPVGSFYIMPVPTTAGMTLRFEGQAPLSPLINDTDKCIIDSTAIVLFAAAEIMANQKNEAAPMKLQKAQNHLRKLLANQGANKRDNYNMGGNHRGGIDPDKGRRAVPYIDYIP